MDAGFVPILLALTALAALFGRITWCVLDRRRREAEAVAGDDVLKRARGAGGGRGRRHAALVRQQLPDALDMISNSLTAGLTLPQALMRNLEHMPPELQGEMARVLYDIRLGYSVADAFANLAARLGTRDVKMISIASRIGVEHGGNLAESYRLLSGMMRDAIGFEMELKAMTTEGRMQALVMSCLPFALLLLLSLISWDMFGSIFTTAAGLCVLLGLCCMLGLAYAWIRRIVDIEV